MASPVPGDAALLVLRPGPPTQGRPGLHAEIAASVLAGARTLVVDASGVSSLSSDVLSALLWAQQRCRARGGGVIVRDPSRGCADLLARAGLADVLTLEGPGRAAARGERM